MGALGNMGMPFQKEFANMVKQNSDTSSISLSCDKNINKMNEKKLFGGYIPKTNGESELSKKRKRYIKNNKFVYVHPGSAAAKKMDLDKVRLNC